MEDNKMINDDFAINRPEKNEIKKKKNRTLKYQEETKYDALNMKPEALQDLAYFLNSDKGKHVDMVYFSREGHHHFNVYPWKGKFFSRLEKEVVNGVEILLNYQGREIIKTLSAEEVIDIVYSWKLGEDKQK